MCHIVPYSYLKNTTLRQRYIAATCTPGNGQNARIHRICTARNLVIPGFG